MGRQGWSRISERYEPLAMGAHVNNGAEAHNRCNARRPYACHNDGGQQYASHVVHTCATIVIHKRQICAHENQDPELPKHPLPPPVVGNIIQRPPNVVVPKGLGGVVVQVFGICRQPTIGTLTKKGGYDGKQCQVSIDHSRVVHDSWSPPVKITVANGFYHTIPHQH